MINKTRFTRDFVASTLLNNRVALFMQKQPGFDWKRFWCHFTGCECLQIVNNTLLLMYEATIVFRGEMQTLRANMAERSDKVYIWKCKINYVQAVSIVQGKKSHLAVSMQIGFDCSSTPLSKSKWFFSYLRSPHLIYSKIFQERFNYLVSPFSKTIARDPD